VAMFKGMRGEDALLVETMALELLVLVAIPIVVALVIVAGAMKAFVVVVARPTMHTRDRAPAFIFIVECKYSC
jgi:hypothetical protein